MRLGGNEYDLNLFKNYSYVSMVYVQLSSSLYLQQIRVCTAFCWMGLSFWDKAENSNSFSAEVRPGLVLPRRQIYFSRATPQKKRLLSWASMWTNCATVCTMSYNVLPYSFQTFSECKYMRRELYPYAQQRTLWKLQCKCFTKVHLSQMAGWNY
jgi:hypothetical protein